MRGGIRLGLGHLVAFVAVALVLNAQFTWWVYYSLRENRERLDLQRALFGARVEGAALRMTVRVEEAARRMAELPPGVIPSPSPPFVEVQVVEAGTLSPLEPGRGAAATTGWLKTGGRVAFARPLGHERVALALLDAQAPYRWLAAIDPTLQLVEQGAVLAGRPQTSLGPPFERLVVTPDFHRWEDLVDRYRQRVVRVLAEGVLFLAGVLTAVVLLWRVLRRESALERQHQNFVSAVTHELKTPIAGIRLALETVLSGRVDDDGRQRFLSNALADSERLGDLVEKVLDVTRYTGGAHRLRMGLGDFSQLVQDEVEVAERRVAARGGTLQADVTPGVQAMFDPEALAIVISNLIENALKYAQGGSPSVRVRLRLERGEAALEVSDDGVGIAPADLEAIFKPFYRASDEVTRRTPGTGIGLFVAREIVNAHGGRLTAASAGPGRGATFRLSLPGAEVLPEDEFSEYIEGHEER
ncbi:MAG TPA: HAMP domain-containing sensor histidine kinase [Thermoanaerobaculaceae bacterium]|nr:HAMP domain-containing sensor histidine kinase [Thermoanaerobaculaceae bacterium]